MRNQLNEELLQKNRHPGKDAYQCLSIKITLNFYASDDFSDLLLDESFFKLKINF